MTTGDYTALPGETPEQKLNGIGIVPGATLDVRTLAAVSARYGVAVYLFFVRDLARRLPLEQVIHRYRDAPEDMRPYIRVEAFLRYVGENDPVFAGVMARDPVMVTIVAVGQIAADPAIPPLVYITGEMPYLEEMDL